MLPSPHHLPPVTQPIAHWDAHRWMYVFWPFTLPLMALVRLFGRIFIADMHRLGELRLQVGARVCLACVRMCVPLRVCA